MYVEGLEDCVRNNIENKLWGTILDELAYIQSGFRPIYSRKVILSLYASYRRSYSKTCFIEMKKIPEEELWGGGVRIEKADNIYS